MNEITLFKGQSCATLIRIMDVLIDEVFSAAQELGTMACNASAYNNKLEYERAERMKAGIMHNHFTVGMIRKVLEERHAPVKTNYTDEEVADMVRINMQEAVRINMGVQS